MYYIEHFDYKGRQEEIQEYFQKFLFPCLHEKELKGHFFSTQYGLGHSEYCFIIQFEEISSMGLFMEIVDNDCEIRDKIRTNRFSIVNDIEQKDDWIRESGKTYHMESFKPTIPARELEKFFIESAFPYLRYKDFHVKLLKTGYNLGTPDYLFITEMDNFASIDQWPEKTFGDREGKKILENLIDIIDKPKAIVIREL